MLSGHEPAQAWLHSVEFIIVVPQVNECDNDGGLQFHVVLPTPINGKLLFNVDEVEM